MAFVSTGVSAERDRLVKLVLAERDSPTTEYISHNRISECIGVKYGTNRYRSVLSAAMKKLLKEESIQLLAKNGMGYSIGSSKGCVKYVHSGVNSTERKMKKLGSVSNIPKHEDLDNSERLELNALRATLQFGQRLFSKPMIKKIHQLATDKGSQPEVGDLKSLFGS